MSILSGGTAVRTRCTGKPGVDFNDCAGSLHLIRGRYIEIVARNRPEYPSARAWHHGLDRDIFLAIIRAKNPRRNGENRGVAAG